jgi:hypothetical protein
MMVRRPYQRIRILDAARQHRIGCLDAAAGGKQGYFIAAGADARAIADGAAVRRRQSAHRFDVAVGVKIAQLTVLGRARLQIARARDCGNRARNSPDNRRSVP